MTEGNNTTNVYVNAQSVNMVAEVVREMNIRESYIHELRADRQTEQSTGDTMIRSRVPGHSRGYGQFRQSHSIEAPTGPGWIRLSEKTYMNNKQPLMKRSNVYKGTHRCAGEWHNVAIKLIPYDGGNFKEAKLLLKLKDHPNIIRMYDADEIQGLTPQIYIVMELCKQTLKDYIEENRSKPFTFEQYFSYAKQIISGVAFIHKKKILHRDIKLENILISHSTENIRVADFGISKQIQDGHSAATATARGLGTDGYQAPEMLRENPKASFYSDSFSLGVVLSMLFSNGQHPFGCDPARWRTNILDQKQPDLSEIRRFKKPYTRCRDQLLDLIKRALSPNPQNRPTPNEMLEHSFFKESSDKSTVNFGKKHENSATMVKHLHEQATKLMRENKFLEASKILYQLCDVDKSDKLTVALQILTCEATLQSDRFWESCQRLEDSILKFRPTVEASDMSSISSEQNRYTRALGLVRMANQIQQTDDKSPDEAARYISDVVYCIGVISDYFTDHGRHTLIRDTDVALEYMGELLSDLRALNNVSTDVRAQRESCVLNNICLTYGTAGYYEKAISFAKKGIDCLEKHYFRNAGKVIYYGTLLFNCGNFYYDSRKYYFASWYYVRAIEAYKVAENISEEKRKREIIAAKRNRKDALVMQKMNCPRTEGIRTH